MKKFSQSQNIKINSEDNSKKELEDSSNLELKYKILELIDDILRVRSYGSVDYYSLPGSIKIEGKEVLADAILELISENLSSNKVKLLESLKSQTGDWLLLDKKIDEVKFTNISANNIKKFNSILENYDVDNSIPILEKKLEKIRNKKTLTDYLILIENANISDITKSKLSKFIVNKLEK